MDILLSNSSGVPIYRQIVDTIKGHIMNGTLKAGEALPSIRLLAQQLRISVITTKRAYEELEQDGFLETVPGKGCFVRPQSPELLREETLRQTEALLEKACLRAKQGGLTLEEMRQMLELMYGGDTNV